MRWLGYPGRRDSGYIGNRMQRKELPGKTKRGRLNKFPNFYRQEEKRKTKEVPQLLQARGKEED